MINFKVNRKTEMKKAFSSVLSNIYNNDWEIAEMNLDLLENYLVQHLITRNNGVKDVKEKIRVIRFYLNDEIEPEAKKRLLEKEISQLLSIISLSKETDPFSFLVSIYEELKDDWSAFWSSPSEGGVSSIADSLDTIGLLEKKFREEGDDIYNQFREILVARANCYVQLPILTMIGRGYMPKDYDRDKVFLTFSKLFSEIEKLMAPFKFKFTKDKKEEEEEKGLVLVKK